ncbi:MAG: response regulator [Nitrospiraceae bacterium]|nr:MAG: response regulator [Nitrospiraceae bacterium]
MRKPRAIIYDDEIILLNLFKEWLTQRGYEVLSFTEPKVCPLHEKKSDRCTQEHKCADVVITDFNMPEMTGLELLQRQCQRGCKLDTKHKAVISGVTEKRIRETIKDMGASFFQKPLIIPEFSEWLSECEKRIDLSVPLGPL